MSRPPLQQLIALLGQSQTLLVTTRADAPVGSIASMLALGMLLERAGKSVAFVTEAMPPLHLRLPGGERCQSTLPREGTTITVDTTVIPVSGLRYDTQPGSLTIMLDANQAIPVEAFHIQPNDMHFDAIITIDTPDLASLGKVFAHHASLWYETPVAVMDRSPLNEQYGQINWIDLTAASTAELVDHLGKALSINPTTQIQQLLLTAIIADTDRFMEPQTTPHAFSMAADLVEAGVDQIAIIRDLYKTRDLTYLQLLGRALTRVQTIPSQSIAWTMITDGDLLETQATKAMIPLMVHEVAHLAPASDIVALLYRANEHTQLTIETTTPILHARDIAALLGSASGGASTATVDVSSTDPNEILEKLGLALGKKP